jgi:hypothetical protein
METASSPSYRITTKSGIVVSDNLPRSAPAIQLHEGTLSKGNKPPKDLSIGESSIVSYPLVEGSLVCRVTRIDPSGFSAEPTRPIEFVEPDPIPKKAKDKPKVAAMLESQMSEAIEGTKVRRGRGTRAVS